MGGQSLKFTADANVLLRGVLQDEPHQGQSAVRALRDADLVAIPLPVLCEYVRMLRRSHKEPASVVADSIAHLISSSNVMVNRPAVKAGLAMMAAGGDFADGVVAYDGSWLGGKEFLSFDEKAVTLLQSQGVRASLLT
jgi:predicted nucleic-acid-binding protein